MKENLKVTIIVPVYNGEKYLYRCLNSIKIQEYSNIEVLILNDGSTDLTEKIANEYVEKDDRFKLINKINSGVSSTRNLGIEMATGYYIMFVDSDDYVADNFVSSMIENIQSDETSLCLCQFDLNIPFMKNDDLIFHEVGSICTKEKVLFYLINSSTKCIYGFIWRGLYKKSILDNYQIRFEEKIKMSEDFLFLLEYINCCDKISFCQEKLYTYCLNNNSATAKYISCLDMNMESVNNYMYENIVRENPSLLKGYCCCEVNTYLQIVQNVCKSGSPYNSLKDKYTYINSKRKHYVKFLRKLPLLTQERKTLMISHILFLFHLEVLYIIIYRLKLSGKYGRV